MIKEKIILGIDPGTVVLGYGIIKLKGQQMSCLHCDVIKLKGDDDHTLRLKQIFEALTIIIDKYNPDELAIEAPFFGKNVQSMLKLGRAQGVAMAAALQRDIPVFEYSPRKVKQSVTGNGNASKEQLAVMVQRLLGLKELPKYLDASDALSVAICHHFQSKTISSAGKSFSNWKSFLGSNPDRKV
ncbi:MAG: crossover junction endodeoxyribonuclease RuvC [Bacteroidetes bacterium]|nr:crossover junction endodeoxyribonuclease RuvC [Bacteroidota bacterium]